jgi:outer membrane scaffolding protein for murein synthesis (MipA/OmpV family)
MEDSIYASDKDSKHNKQGASWGYQQNRSVMVTTTVQIDRLSRSNRGMEGEEGVM